MAKVLQYKVKAEAITVLREREIATDEITRSLKKGQLIEDVIPEAWFTTDGKWINVVVNKGQVLEPGEYEPNRLHQLFLCGCLDILNGNPKDSKPTDDNKPLGPNGEETLNRIAKGEAQPFGTPVTRE